jgi:hypothetical protein
MAYILTDGGLAMGSVSLGTSGPLGCLRIGGKKEAGYKIIHGYLEYIA